MHADLQETDWVPHSFQEAARNLAKKTVKHFVRPNQVIGLGSGPMAASIVREMANFDGKETLERIPTSFQIKLEAQCSGLKLVDEYKMPEVDVVFDGADEVDAKFNMIKGGTLLREKIVHSAAKRIVIAAESTKFVPTFSWPVPIEMHPFAIHILQFTL
jgi:ribose 5-phosphate isomerase A